ncbi:TetR/AcrR family transcriptional regulator [Nguyenibacter vanlangensis]|uniref:TetR/AcrR family transcriptional regulator n=1 Tax=Nguyenibacter vanlangensis TaxID=1216886 RepID=A0ABZ3D8V0_9PROT
MNAPPALGPTRGQVHNPAHGDTRQRILDTARPIIGGRGFSAVGLNEILGAAQVPKGSFYHYFASKEAFGEALLERYFTQYLARLDVVLGTPGAPAADRLMSYWQGWREGYVSGDIFSQCLAVKLGAEVCDLSEGMRAILQDGTGRIVDRLARCIDDGRRDGSLVLAERKGADPGTADPGAVLAMSLYQLWLGATLLAKFTRDRRPFDDAMTTTQRLLNLGAEPRANNAAVS